MRARVPYPSFCKTCNSFTMTVPSPLLLARKRTANKNCLVPNSPPGVMPENSRVFDVRNCGFLIQKVTAESPSRTSSMSRSSLGNTRRPSTALIECLSVFRNTLSKKSPPCGNCLLVASKNTSAAKAGAAAKMQNAKIKMQNDNAKSKILNLNL